jgi:hypothetical protein
MGQFLNNAPDTKEIGETLQRAGSVGQVAENLDREHRG